MESILPHRESTPITPTRRLDSFSGAARSIRRYNSSRLSIDRIMLREEHDLLATLRRRASFIDNCEARMPKALESGLGKAPPDVIDFSNEVESPPKKCKSAQHRLGAARTEPAESILSSSPHSLESDEGKCPKASHRLPLS